MNVKFTRDHLSHKRGEVAEVNEAYGARVIGQGYAVPVKGKRQPAAEPKRRKEAQPAKVVGE